MFILSPFKHVTQPTITHSKKQELQTVNGNALIHVYVVVQFLFYFVLYSLSTLPYTKTKEN